MIPGSWRNCRRVALVQPSLEERRNAYIVYVLQKPGLHRKVPGLFVFYTPLAEWEYAHVSET